LNIAIHPHRLQRISSSALRHLGSTALKVSRICLGCMTYGAKSWREWVLSEEEGRPLIRRAIEAGITFFDTADTLGVKGCGEAGCAGALPSIMNAVVDALGGRHIDMPAAPENPRRCGDC
jgi:Aldo/keto reductase family